MTRSKPRSHTRNRILGGIAAVFGLATLAASGNVLFGPELAKTLAGDVVPFIVWFNFLAGFAYLAAAVGLWIARPWGHWLAMAIAAATLVAGLGFAFVAVSGTPFEPRTVGALSLRCAVWAALAYFSSPGRRS